MYYEIRKELVWCLFFLREIAFRTSGRALAGGLQPAPASAEAAAAARANATCGELGHEDYCRELPAKRGTICDVCDAEAAARRHPLEHALDGDASTWWQSPTLARGERYQHVSLLFKFPDGRSMKVNVIETELIVIERGKSTAECDTYIEGESVEQVKEFVYSSSLFTNDGKYDRDSECGKESEWGLARCYE
ncbi:Laminin subunit alpha-1 [Eumeta japonica]|uniref:Laminin subunit alpha-1 n=1 Tax=Eumeta variegata TaxID=151549 RepID=A0A4C1WQG4_EUMVA|nr:Laminin subunit alpha-1 [Eumeta japonica]